MFKLLRSQSGYGRLTSGTVTLAVVAILALGYQLYINQRPNLDGVVRRTVPIATGIQFFPQSLPILDNVGYLLEVENAKGQRHSFSKILHRAPGELVFSSGQVIKDGVIQLPPDITDIVSVRLSLFDDRIIQQPIIIPFLEGEIKNDRTVLAYVGAGLDEASGQYSLATPTDNNALVNERSGIWFGDVISNNSKLQLPQLPQGWIYEGWAIIDEKTLTTGRFRSSTTADNFSRFSSNDSASPSFPGEDFLQDPPIGIFSDLAFPLDLAGAEVMISIEPDVNGKDLVNDAPFPMTLFLSSIPNLAQAGVLYDLKLTPDLLPKSTVVVRFSDK